MKWQRGTDQLGRIATVDVYLNASSSSAMNRTYTYDSANQRTRVEQEGSRRWAYGYDGLGQVESAQKQVYASSTWSALPGYDYAFVFDDIGNRKSATTNGRAMTYTSDSLNRYLARGTSLLADVRGTAASGATVLVNDEVAMRTGNDFYLGVPVLGLKENVLKIQAATASPHRVVTEDRSVLVPSVPEAFTYDADGNLTQDGLWNYEWDAENRLIAQELRSDVRTTTWKRLEYSYDREGRRIRKLVKTRTTGGGTWTTASDIRFLYDGWNLIAEYSYASSTFTLLRSHAWGLDLSGSAQGAGGVGGLLWTTVAAISKTYAAAADANGNVIAYVDCADGSVAGKRDYGAFGEAVVTTGVAGSLPFGFSSKYEEKDTGLYYYGFRYYNPLTGRWPNRDPIEERGGMNLYGVVKNNPVNSVDYLGAYLLPPPAKVRHFHVSPYSKTIETYTTVPSGESYYNYFQTVYFYLVLERCYSRSQVRIEQFARLIESSNDPSRPNRYEPRLKPDPVGSTGVVWDGSNFITGKGAPSSKEPYLAAKWDPPGQSMQGYNDVAMFWDSPGQANVSVKMHPYQWSLRLYTRVVDIATGKKIASVSWSVEIYARTPGNADISFYGN